MAKTTTFFALLLYGVLFTAALPFVFLSLLWRSFKAPAYRRRVFERCGMVAGAHNNANGIWLHAVSVGEVIAALPVIAELRQRYPDSPLTVTTTTPTGSAHLLKALEENGLENIAHSYMPYDWPPFVWWFMRSVKPQLLVIMETELWPVTLWLCRRKNVPVVLANARLSEKSAAGYQRVRWLSQGMLQALWVATQYDDDAERFLALGLPEQQLARIGSIKFDIEIAISHRQIAAEKRAQLNSNGRRFIWIAASTHKGEDEKVLAAHRTLLDADAQSLLILVPRHPERFDDVAKRIAEHEFVLRRVSDLPADTNGQRLNSNTQVLLVDSIGQLLMYYGVADMAFVGGSLVAVGGHNPIEPAAWGVPVLAGRHYFNFTEVTRRLIEGQALHVVADEHELAAQLLIAIKQPDQLQSRGAAARRVVEANRGAQQKLMAFIDCQLR